VDEIADPDQRRLFAPPFQSFFDLRRPVERKKADHRQHIRAAAASDSSIRSVSAAVSPDCTHTVASTPQRCIAGTTSVTPKVRCRLGCSPSSQS